MALSEAEREQARRIASELLGIGGRCMYWDHTPEGYDNAICQQRGFWGEIYSKLVAIGAGDSQTDPSEYAENLKLAWTEGFYGVSHSNWPGACPGLEVHFMEAESAIMKSEDGDYIEELVDVILPWEVD